MKFLIFLFIRFLQKKIVQRSDLLNEQVGTQNPHADLSGGFGDFSEKFPIFRKIVFKAEMLCERKGFEIRGFHEQLVLNFSYLLLDCRNSKGEAGITHSIKCKKSVV